jgi:hypothetical protein
VLAVLLIGLCVWACTVDSSQAERKSPVEVIQAENLSGDPTEPNGTHVRGPIEAPTLESRGAARMQSRSLDEEAARLSDFLLSGRRVHILARAFVWILR